MMYPNQFDTTVTIQLSKTACFVFSLNYCSPYSLIKLIDELFVSGLHRSMYLA